MPEISPNYEINLVEKTSNFFLPDEDHEFEIILDKSSKKYSSKGSMKSYL